MIASIRILIVVSWAWVFLSCNNSNTSLVLQNDDHAMINTSCEAYNVEYSSGKIDVSQHLKVLKDSLQSPSINSLKIYNCDLTSIAKVGHEKIYVNGKLLDSLFSIDTIDCSLLFNGILYHETSHLLYGHNKDVLRQSFVSECKLIRKRELEADYFTGVMMHQLDIVKKIDNSTYHLDLLNNGSRPVCYPEIMLRKEYVKLGYLHGQKYDLEGKDIDTYEELQDIGNSIPIIGKKYPEDWNDLDIYLLIKIYKNESSDLIDINTIPSKSIEKIKNYLEEDQSKIINMIDQLEFLEKENKIPRNKIPNKKSSIENEQLDDL